MGWSNKWVRDMGILTRCGALVDRICLEKLYEASGEHWSWTHNS